VGWYVARRLALLPVILFFVSVIVFGLQFLVPGDPAVTLAGENAPPERVEQIRQLLGLDDPIYQQYWRWLTRTVQGDLGRSLLTTQSVGTIIEQRLPVTLSLVSLAIVFSIVFSLFAGVLAATRARRWPDRMVTAGASLGVAIPSFFVGLLLVYVFALSLHWFPAIGFVPLTQDPWQWFVHLLLPAITLALVTAPELTRQLRSGLVDSLGEEYVQAARAKGLSERAVVGKHAMKNAAIPVVTVLGTQIGLLIGGAVLVEKVFGLSGIGSLAVDAVTQRDLAVVQGVVLITCVPIVVINLFVDVSYGYFNPKVRR
jgi:peptide/nickel transport system permease protein